MPTPCSRLALAAHCCSPPCSHRPVALVGSEAVVYNEVHLMYAGAMAAAASGIPIEILFERFVFEPGECVVGQQNSSL